MKPAMKQYVPFAVKAGLRRVLDRVRDEETVISLREKRSFIKKAFAALQFNGIPGDYLEFGTGGGVSFIAADRANRRSSRPLRKLWGFDSFEGLPEETSTRNQHRAWVAGSMACSEAEFRQICRRNGVRNYELVPGFYAESLAKLGPDSFPSGSIAMVYVDCDLYSSTQKVLDFLWPRLSGGVIIAFDDYFNFNQSGVSGERRALEERLATGDGRFRLQPYIQYGYAGHSFIVEDSAAC